jgi:N-acetylmuramoyl-L-alanine amidase
MKIAISSGHLPNGQGAAIGRISEYGATSEVVGKTISILSKYGHEVWDIGSASNTEQVRRINALSPDIGLEIHLNSVSDPSVNGTEVLHSNSVKGISLAKCIQESLVDTLKTKDRGTRVGHYRGDPKYGLCEMIKNTVCPFVIVEPLFLSNIEDLSRLDCSLIAAGISLGIKEYDLL